MPQFGPASTLFLSRARRRRLPDPEGWPSCQIFFGLQVKKSWFSNPRPSRWKRWKWAPEVFRLAAPAGVFLTKRLSVPASPRMPFVYRTPQAATAPGADPGAHPASAARGSNPMAPWRCIPTSLDQHLPKGAEKYRTHIPAAVSSCARPSLRTGNGLRLAASIPTLTNRVARQAPDLRSDCSTWSVGHRRLRLSR